MMKFGIAAWGLRETVLEEQLAMARRLGVELLELGIAGHPDDRLQADAGELEIRQVQELFAQSGVTLLCAATGNDFTSEEPEQCFRSLETVKKVLRIADCLGVRFLRIFAGFSPLECVSGERWDIQLECLKKVYAAAENTQVIPVVETHGGVITEKDDSVRHYSSTSTDYNALDRILEEVPEMRLNFDPANLFVVDIDVCAFYRRYQEKIVYMHLKDFVRSGCGFFPAACGKGRMDWMSLLREIKDFQGPVMLEYEIPANVEEGFRESLDFIRRKKASIAH